MLVKTDEVRLAETVIAGRTGGIRVAVRVIVSVCVQTSWISVASVSGLQIELE